MCSVMLLLDAEGKPTWDPLVWGESRFNDKHAWTNDVLERVGKRLSEFVFVRSRVCYGTEQTSHRIKLLIGMKGLRITVHELGLWSTRF